MEAGNALQSALIVKQFQKAAVLRCRTRVCSLSWSSTRVSAGSSRSALRDTSSTCRSQACRTHEPSVELNGFFLFVMYSHNFFTTFIQVPTFIVSEVAVLKRRLPREISAKLCRSAATSGTKLKSHFRRRFTATWFSNVHLDFSGFPKTLLLENMFFSCSCDHVWRSCCDCVCVSSGTSGDCFSRASCDLRSAGSCGRIHCSSARRHLLSASSCGRIHCSSAHRDLRRSVNNHQACSASSGGRAHCSSSGRIQRRFPNTGCRAWMWSGGQHRLLEGRDASADTAHGDVAESFHTRPPVGLSQQLLMQWQTRPRSVLLMQDMVAWLSSQCVIILEPQLLESHPQQREESANIRTFSVAAGSTSPWTS